MDSPEAPASAQVKRLASAGLGPADLEPLERALLEEGWQLMEAGEPRASLFQPGGADAVLLDGSLALEQGVWLDFAGRSGVLVPVAAVVDRRQAALVPKLLRGGVADCLVRPLRPEKVLAALRQSVGLQALQVQVDRRLQAVASENPFSGIVGDSPAMQRLLSQAAMAARHPVDVLILGETGTGKELLAKAVHGASGRRQRPFVAVDCGALPPDLVEGLLFGQKKGAFTGAVEDKAGLLEQADGGTILLDEVGNLPLDAQTKLLRVLQTRENWRLGDTQPRPLDLRVLAATNSNLEDQAHAGRFRLDLYHRLCDFPLRIPPLRDRAGDIELLARLFLNRFRARFHLDEVGISPEALERLKAYAWPGNVRQLENTMKQTAVLAEADVRLEQLPQELLTQAPPEAATGPKAAVPAFSMPQGTMPLWKAERLVLAELEGRLLGEALLACGGDRDEAAKRLQLHPKTLARKLKEHRLS